MIDLPKIQRHSHPIIFPTDKGIHLGTQIKEKHFKESLFQQLMLFSKFFIYILFYLTFDLTLFYHLHPSFSF